MLGLDEIHHYDTYVPIVADIETDVSFDEAIEKVLASLAPLGDEYCDTLGDGPARALVRSLRKQRQTQRRVQFHRQLRHVRRTS